MKNKKITKCLITIVFLSAVSAEVQWEESVSAAMEADTAAPAAAVMIDVEPDPPGAEGEVSEEQAVTASEAETEDPSAVPVPEEEAAEDPAVVPDPEEEADGGPATVPALETGAEDSAPSFHSVLSGDSGVPEQPTLRQVLESMKPPSLTDDESAPGSVWLHSKAGPDMAEEVGSGQPGRSAPSAAEQGQDAGRLDQNVTVTEGLEGPVATADNTTSNSTSKLCNCLPLNQTQEELTVKLVNATALSDALSPDGAVRSRSQPAVCLLVVFYGSTCPFSAAAAPHVNAVPRAFPDLRVLAVDALENGSLNTRFGIIAVPTVLLFHNGRPQARFNQSEPTLQRLADFVSSHTQLVPAVPLNVTSADFSGPLPAVAEVRVDWYLLAAWLFILACAVYAATRLRLWRRAADNVRNWWIEAEQHLHEE